VVGAREGLYEKEFGTTLHMKGANLDDGKAQYTQIRHDGEQGTGSCKKTRMPKKGSCSRRTFCLKIAAENQRGSSFARRIKSRIREFIH